jgi:hypothetical protein
VPNQFIVRGILTSLTNKSQEPSKLNTIASSLNKEQARTYISLPIILPMIYIIIHRKDTN